MTRRHSFSATEIARDMSAVILAVTISAAYSILLLQGMDFDALSSLVPFLIFAFGVILVWKIRQHFKLSYWALPILTCLIAVNLVSGDIAPHAAINHDWRSLKFQMLQRIGPYHAVPGLDTGWQEMGHGLNVIFVLIYLGMVANIITTALRNGIKTFGLGELGCILFILSLLFPPEIDKMLALTGFILLLLGYRLRLEFWAALSLMILPVQIAMLSAAFQSATPILVP